MYEKNGIIFTKNSTSGLRDDRSVLNEKYIIYSDFYIYLLFIIYFFRFYLCFFLYKIMGRLFRLKAN